MVGCRGGVLLTAVQILAVCFPDLRYLFPQLCNALFHELLHGDRLAEDLVARRIGVMNEIILSNNQFD
jgi:hypothetical protein